MKETASARYLYASLTISLRYHYVIASLTYHVQNVLMPS